VTSVTLWDDGRALFGAPGAAPYREARLGRDAVARLLASADVLYGMADFYAAAAITDAGSTGFTIERARGRKSVEVYALGLDAARPGEPHHAELEQLRALWREVEGALPASAPALRADDVDEVIVALSPGIEWPPRSRPGMPSCAERGVTRTWPSDAVGRLTGAAARDAVRSAGSGTLGEFCVDGQLQQVWVRPVLPVLSLPSRNWPSGGLPRHPAATAYDSGQVYAYDYRAPGVPGGELAAWYRTAMAARGWRLAHDAPDRQVWVRPRLEEADPLVELRFADGGVEMRYVRVEQGVPHHPRGVLGGCAPPAGGGCQLVNAPPDAARIWFREYLAYLGYVEVAPDVHQLGPSALRLVFREEQGGTAVTAAAGPAAARPPLSPNGSPNPMSTATPPAAPTLPPTRAGARVTFVPTGSGSRE